MTSKKNTKNKSHDLNTVHDFILFAVTKFDNKQAYFGHGTDNPWDEAVYLVLHTLGLALDSNQVVLSKKLTSGGKQKLLKIINNRVKERIPAAYLTQESWFAGLPFYVDERVLIPRSPIAELIEAAFVPWVNPKKVSRILDIGTGSGCIAIACAYAFPKAKIDAIDVSQDALKVAAINCAKHKVTKRIRLLKSNLFEKLEGKTYDLIISNPPYVGNAEMKTLPKEYCHEPKMALLAGKDGDEIVVRIIESAAKYLSPRGVLIVEVGNSAPMILRKYPRLPFIWLEFERGEGEVFLITREQLLDLDW